MATPPPLIALVDDEPQVRRFIRASLKVRGYRLIEGSTVQEALLLVSSHNPELLLLDLGLPDGDGIELTRRLREWSHVPIIILSARHLEQDKVAALDAGADDYISKPFGIDELLARMRVALRHAQTVATSETPQVLELGLLKIDLVHREVTQSGTVVRLTPIEHKLLVLLARNAGRVLTHHQILAEIWGPKSAHIVHQLRVHMAELRKKVEVDPARPKFIITEPGVGYRLRELENTLHVQSQIGEPRCTP